MTNTMSGNKQEETRAMPTTDLSVAALRALLTRHLDQNRQLMAKLGDEGLRAGYFPLLTGAFMEAVTLRFRGAKRSEMVRWVADARTKLVDDKQIDPNVTERMILWVFGKSTVDDVDFEVLSTHQVLLLGLLVEEQGYDDAELDAFLQRARTYTDKMMSGGEAG